MNTIHAQSSLRATPHLEKFVARLESLVSTTRASESNTVDGVVAAMRELVAQDNWLDRAYTQPHPQFYQQYLLHADPLGRFSVVSFVWDQVKKRRCTTTALGA